MHQLKTLIAVVLHNYLRQTENVAYCPSAFIGSEASSGFDPVIEENLFSLKARHCYQT